MTKEEKKQFKIQRKQNRIIKRKELNKIKKEIKYLDCPFDVEMNNLYGTCTCGGYNRDSCMGDI